MSTEKLIIVSSLLFLAFLLGSWQITLSYIGSPLDLGIYCSGPQEPYPLSLLGPSIDVVDLGEGKEKLLEFAGRTMIHTVSVSLDITWQERWMVGQPLEAVVLF